MIWWNCFILACSRVPFSSGVSPNMMMCGNVAGSCQNFQQSDHAQVSQRPHRPPAHFRQTRQGFSGDLVVPWPPWSPVVFWTESLWNAGVGAASCHAFHARYRLHDIRSKISNKRHGSRCSSGNLIDLKSLRHKPRGNHQNRLTFISFNIVHPAVKL